MFASDLVGEDKCKHKKGGYLMTQHKANMRILALPSSRRQTQGHCGRYRVWVRIRSNVSGWQWLGWLISVQELVLSLVVQLIWSQCRSGVTPTKYMFCMLSDVRRYAAMIKLNRTHSQVMCPVQKAESCFLLPIFIRTTQSLPPFLCLPITVMLTFS